MRYYVCECGAEFDDDQQGAREHMLDEHLDLIETRFEDLINEGVFEEENFTEEEYYDEAIEEVTEELLDLTGDED